LQPLLTHSTLLIPLACEFIAQLALCTAPFSQHSPTNHSPSVLLQRKWFIINLLPRLLSYLRFLQPVRSPLSFLYYDHSTYLFVSPIVHIRWSGCESFHYVTSSILVSDTCRLSFRRCVHLLITMTATCDMNCIWPPDRMSPCSLARKPTYPLFTVHRRYVSFPW
jgi:hypothetical protein